MPIFLPPYADVVSETTLATRQESIPRLLAQGSSSLTGGVISCAYFLCDFPINAANLATQCSGTLAAGLTFAKLALYTVDGSNNLTCVARTASDTTMWAANNTLYTKAIVDNGAASPGAISNYQLVKGQRYATAILATGTTMPQLASLRLAGGNGSGIAGLLPLLATVTAGGQTDLPATIAVGSLNGNGAMFWIALT